MNPTIDCAKPIAVNAVDADLPLVDASLNGDVSAFEELVKRYDRKLYRIARGITHSNEDAEEVVQTAFLKAYQYLDRFQGNAKFSTWLVRITMNESFMKLRKQSSNQEESLDTMLGFGDRQLLPGRLNLADWTTSPESLYMRTELRRILDKSLQKLRPGLRVVFILRDIEGHSINETSGMLNLSATAVKTRLSRARLQLREELTRYFKRTAL